MGRKLYIEEHRSAEELKTLYQKSKDPVESRRYHLLWLVKQDYTLVEAAQIVGMNYSYSPPYSPELQPAERLWSLTDEPLVNRCFDTIEAIEDLLVERCMTLANTMSEHIRGLTHFYWWPA